MAVPSKLEPPRDLTIPEAGSTTARDVLSRSIGRLMGELRAIVRDPAALPLPRADAEALRELVTATLAERPGALASALRRPTASVLLRTMRHELTSAGDRARVGALLGELLGTLALDLAAAHALPNRVRVSRMPSRVLSLGARLAIEAPRGTSAIFEDGAFTLETGGGRTRVALDEDGSLPPGVTRPYVPVKGAALALADNNPLAMLEAHPDKEGNALSLGGRSSAEWCGALTEALSLVEAELPDLYADLALYVQQLVPVGYDAEKHLSASYQESIGTIYLTLHPSLMTMAEALIHEFSHNKLNALFELDEVLGNAWSPLYASPLRPDPRPLHGVLLAVHAFLPVARLYEAMIAAGHPLATPAAFHERFARIRAINRGGAGVVLANGVPTELGRGLLDEIRRWDAHFSGA